MMNIFLALEVIEQMELDLGAMYAKLRSKFSDNRDLASLFHQFHLDDLDHAQRVSLQQKVVQAKPGDFGEVYVNFNELYRAKYRATVILSMPREKIRELLLQCYLVESSLVEQYFVAALKNTDPEVRQLLEMLGQGFRDHVASLAIRIQDLGADPANLDAIRLAPRVAFSCEVMVDKKMQAKSLDIGEGGMFLMTQQSFPEDEIIALSFPIGNDMVAAKAVVKHSIPNVGVGLLFKNLSEKHRMLIRTYVDDALQTLSNERQSKRITMGDDLSVTP